MNIDKPPIITSFFDVAGNINRVWQTWFNSVYNRFNQLFTISNELKIKVYEQDAEPELTDKKTLALWVDTNDSDKVYLIFKRGDSDQVKTELI